MFSSCIPTLKDSTEGFEKPHSVRAPWQDRALHSSPHLAQNFAPVTQSTEKHNTLLLPNSWQLTRLIVVMPLKNRGTLEQLLLPLKSMDDGPVNGHILSTSVEIICPSVDGKTKNYFYIRFYFSAITNTSRNWIRLILLHTVSRQLYRNSPKTDALQSAWAQHQQLLLNKTSYEKLPEKGHEYSLCSIITYQRSYK